MATEATRPGPTRAAAAAPPASRLAAALRPASGVAVVAVTFFYFLLFAQFGFLELLQQRLGSAAGVQRAMAAMGVAGLLGSLGTGWLLGRVRGARLVPAGLLAAAAAAGAAVGVRGGAATVAASAAVGLATALLTVAVAAELPALLARGRTGLQIGAGTGLGYALANVPALFTGAPELRALLPAAACLAVLPLAWRAGGPRAATRPDAQAEPPSTGGLPLAVSFAPLGVAGMGLALLALIGLDSAAFAVVQATPGLRAATWGGSGAIAAQGLVHLAAALAAGAWVDRGRLRTLAAAALALFAVAFARLASAAAGGAGPLYAVGISAYSVALVAYAAWPALRRGEVAARWRAAWVFGVAGWVGSALGVGAAQELHRVPGWLVLAAAALALPGLLLAGPRGPALLRLYGGAAAAAVVAVPLALAWRPAQGGELEPGTPPPTAGPAGAAAAGAAAAPAAPSAARGREVYVAEGCIHCHSQYVRPGGRDLGKWGPHRPLDRRERPPLVGNRRQGPDLANAGNRRSPRWHEAHLVAPQTLSPGSRMPSYRHLFAAGDGRGAHLVAYLATLGAGTADARWAEISALPREDPAAVANGGDADAGGGRRLFATYCAVCHGAGGEGDGPLATVLERPAADLRRAQRAPEDLPRLARVVRFGIPGTGMPGHEQLRPAEVAALVSFVAGLPPAAGSGG